MAKLTAELNLKNLILELREVSQALNECADKLLMIEIKYDKEKLLSFPTRMMPQRLTGSRKELSLVKALSTTG